VRFAGSDRVRRLQNAGSRCGRKKSENSKPRTAVELAARSLRWHRCRSSGEVKSIPLPRPLLLLAWVAIAALLAAGAARADPETDRKIEDAARESYNFKAVLKKQVVVHAEEGVVTLNGTVHDRQQRTLAEETVRNLPGVVSVNNELEVASPEHERGDGWIALKIRGILLVRANVSAAQTDVVVRDGVVTLTGTVDDERQKELTAAYARSVQGVKEVRNRLQVRSGNGELPPDPVTDRS